MEEILNRAEELVTHVKEYVDNRVSSAKLKAAEKTSGIVSSMLAAVIVGAVFFLFTLFASTSLAYALSGLTGKVSLGFLIVAGFYLLAGFIVWTGRKKILQLPILKSLLKQLFKEDEQD